jgi:hypothetical protein
MVHDADCRPVPSRRRPGALVVLVRWRLELAVVVGVTGALWLAGGVVAATVVAALLALAATTPVVRRGLVRGWQLVVLPHRVRSALVQAGVTTRGGYLPWILWARSAGPNVVRVELKLLSGITVQEIRRAAPVIAGACAAVEVWVFTRAYRPDRATVLLLLPRWGMR